MNKLYTLETLLRKLDLRIFKRIQLSFKLKRPNVAWPVFQ